MGMFAGFQLKNTTAAMARKCPGESTDSLGAEPRALSILSKQSSY